MVGYEVSHFPSVDLFSRISSNGSSQLDFLRRIFSVRSPPTNLLSWISSNGIFSAESPTTNLLSRISYDGSLRWIFSVKSSLTNLFRQLFSSSAILNPITSTPSWNTSGIALPSTSDRIKYTFITSFVHITYMLQLKREC